MHQRVLAAVGHPHFSGRDLGQRVGQLVTGIEVADGAADRGLQIGVGLFGFTLSYDEFARTLMAAGSFNTLPLEIYAMTTNVTTPVLYALGAVTTLFSFLVIAGTLGLIVHLNRRRQQT